tara:strand:+ start:966 stop:1676 length:711 start_codon:yes stop_codon:yes gene_type:complete
MNISKLDQPLFSYSMNTLLGLATALLLSACGAGSGASGGGGGEADISGDLELLNSENAEDRENGLLHLIDHEGGAQGGTKAVELLKDENMRVASAAIKFVVKHKTDGATDALGSLATDAADDGVKIEALQALNDLGATDKYVEISVGMLKSSDAAQQSMGANNLGRVEGGAPAAQEALIAALGSGNAEVKSQCAYALGILGSKASAEAKTALETASKDSDKNVAQSAKDALAAINQ